MGLVNLCTACGKSFPARDKRDKLCQECADDRLFQAQVLAKSCFPGSKVVAHEHR
jgi:hypothetical protein